MTLHVEVDGADEAPPVVMLHGITMSGRTWDWVVDDLATRFRVVRLDFRGHGRSGRAPGGYESIDYVGDAVAACEQVAGRPCYVVGHSLGGGTAAALAQRRPDIVLGAVLEDPPLDLMARSSDDNNPLLNGFALMYESVPRLQKQQIPQDVLAAALGRAPSPSGPTFADLLHADALDVMAECLLRLDVNVLDGVVNGRMRPAYDPEQGIPVPALVVGADPASPDAVLRPAVVERLQRISPHVEVEVVAGASHFLHDEQAHRDDFRRLLLGFLAAREDLT